MDLKGKIIETILDFKEDVAKKCVLAVGLFESKHEETRFFVVSNDCLDKHCFYDYKQATAFVNIEKMIHPSDYYIIRNQVQLPFLWKVSLLKELCAQDLMNLLMELKSKNKESKRRNI